METGSRSDYTRSVTKPYAQVVEAIKEATTKQEGFTVSNVHDIAATLRKAGIEHAPVATIEVCNPKIAAEVLKAEPRLASLIPCRIAVYQQDDKTVVSMIWPSRLMTMFAEKPEVKKTAAQVDEAMKAIVDAATR